MIKVLREDFNLNILYQLICCWGRKYFVGIVQCRHSQSKSRCAIENNIESHVKVSHLEHQEMNIQYVRH